MTTPSTPSTPSAPSAPLTLRLNFDPREIRDKYISVATHNSCGRRSIQNRYF